MDLLTDKETKPLDELFQQVGVYRSGTNLLHLLEFIRMFPKLAPFNAMLLHIQKPGARYVLRAQEWKITFNRTIKPGATPLVTLIPFGPVKFVFDLSDTDGDQPFPEELLSPFKIYGAISKEIFNKLLTWLHVLI